jgi:hypothetical protein
VANLNCDSWLRKAWMTKVGEERMKVECHIELK